MEYKQVKSISDNLSKYDYCVSKNSDNDFIEITQWQNEEGYTISLGDKTIILTEGEIDAINHLINCMRYE